jgi:PAS domain S-box-containing protein
MVKEDGTTFWVHLVATAASDADGAAAFRVVLTDVTARRRAEAELREARRREQAVLLESEKKYRLVFDSANDAIFVHDEQARMLAVNPVACQWLGYTHAELISMTIDQLDAPEESQHMPDRRSRLLERGQLVFETVHRHKNDLRIPTEVSSRTIIWEGQPAVLSICRDITDRKQAEVVLVEANRQLEASMVRAQELTAQAQAANAAKSRFLATMNHETRTPLNAILGFSQLLEQDPTLAIDHKSRVATINRSGEHLLTLLNDILEFSKNQDGQQASVSSPFDLPFLLRDLERVFRPQTDAKQLTLRMDGLDEVERYLIADERKLRRILTNLLGNAVKFTTTGGIWVRASTKPQGTDGLRLVVLVGDSGPGIATEEIGRLFAAFEQGEVGKRSCLGTGLGLAISRQLARLMGGDVSVRSEVGQGSVFRLEILAQPATESMVEVKLEGSQVQSGLDGVHAPASQPDGTTVAGSPALIRERLDSVPAELRKVLPSSSELGVGSLES